MSTSDQMQLPEITPPPPSYPRFSKESALYVFEDLKMLSSTVLCIHKFAQSEKTCSKFINKGFETDPLRPEKG